MFTSFVYSYMHEYTKKVGAKDVDSVGIWAYRRVTM